MIDIHDLEITLGRKNIIKKVDVHVGEGEFVGLIGPNGSGKSTMLKAVYRVISKYDGDITILGDDLRSTTIQESALRTSVVPQHTYSPFDFKVIDVVLMGRSPHKKSMEFDNAEDREIAIEALKKVDMYEFADRSFFTLSGGEQQRIVLARAMAQKTPCMVLDEPTNHLDIETVGWLENYLSGYSGCLIAVSHDRYFLDRVTNKTLMIEHRKGRVYRGGWSASAAERQRDREIQERHYINQQKEIKRQEEYIEQQRRWNRERNIIAAESRQKLLDKLVRETAPEKDERTVRMKFIPSLPSGNDVFTVRDLGFSYDRKKNLFEGLSFTVKKGERLFIVGPNGCGKSTLVKLLAGKLKPSAGAIDEGSNLRVGYYDQQNQGLGEDKTVFSVLKTCYPGMADSELRGVLGTFLFRGDDVFKEVSVLSGGERARLTLAKLMLSEMNTCLLDEPTNHLDIGSREALENALGGFEGTLVCVSHDRSFINSLATVILGFSADGRIMRFPVSLPGRGWDEWCEAKKSGMFATEAGIARADCKSSDMQCAEAGEPAGALTAKDAWLKKKDGIREARKRETRLARLTDEKNRLESLIDGLNAELYGDAAADYERAAELSERIAKAEDRLLEVYGELEELQDDSQ